MNVFDTVPPTMHTPNDAPNSLFNSTCTLFPQPISNHVHESCVSDKFNAISR